MIKIYIFFDIKQRIVEIRVCASLVAHLAELHPYKVEVAGS